MGLEEGHKHDRGMEHLFYEDMLRELRLINPEKRMLSGDLTAAFQYQKKAYRKDGGWEGGGEKSSSGSVAIGQAVVALNWKKTDLNSQ